VKFGKTTPDFEIRTHVEFCKIKKYPYTFFFFLLFKPIHQHALARELFKPKEWWEDISNTSAISRLRGMSHSPPTELVFYLNCCQNTTMQTSSNETIKMTNKVYNQQPKHPKFSLNTHFPLFRETRLASSMKRPKLKALRHKQEKMLIYFLDRVSLNTEHISPKVNKLSIV